MKFRMPRHGSRLMAALLLAAALVIPYGSVCRADQGKAVLNTDDGELVLLVTLPHPPPVNLIAGLNLKKNARIVATSPKADKVDQKKSVVKWLVKNPKAGTLRFSVKTSPPVKMSSVSAVVTYRKPGDGSLVTIEADKNN